VKFQLLQIGHCDRHFMKLNLDKIGKEVKLMLNVFWQKLFLVLILFIVINFLIAGVFFYVYYVKAQKERPVSPLLLSINQVLLESVFSKWDEKEIEFQEAMSHEFPNVFREIPLPISPVGETSSTGVATSSEEISEE